MHAKLPRVGIKLLALFLTGAACVAQADENLVMSCAVAVEEGAAPNACKLLQYSKPATSSKKIVFSDSGTPRWQASAWRTFQGLPEADRLIACTADVPVDTPFQAGVAGADPCPEAKKPWVTKWALMPAEPVGYKWKAGHYVMLDPFTTSPAIVAAHLKQIDALAGTPVMGVKLVLYWGALERAQGDYTQGFKLIDQYLERLAKVNKHLILSVQDRTFGGYSPAKRSEYFPSYITGKFGLTAMASGETLRVWIPAVMDREIALVQALGARYNVHPNFQMLQVEETAISVKAGKDGFSNQALGNQLKRLLVAARAAFPQTLVRLPTNFFGTDAQMLDLLEACRKNDIAVGGPDVLPNQSIQANRLYINRYRGAMVWVAEVQSPELGGKEGKFTPLELYNSGMTMKPSFFVWYRNTWAGGAAQKWDTGMLPFIKGINGAINTACPSEITCQ